MGVNARAIAIDIYKGAEFKKCVAYLAIAWALGPILAPAIGGYLQHYFSWRAPFYFLTAYGVIVFILS
ncbi:MAG: MFS transporter, partial [Gammaproteobacteria bacterium]|nr:MFS transporter [Gammaproteobacteria bacterium]